MLQYPSQDFRAWLHKKRRMTTHNLLFICIIIYHQFLIPECRSSEHQLPVHHVRMQTVSSQLHIGLHSATHWSPLCHTTVSSQSPIHILQKCIVMQRRDWMFNSYAVSLVFYLWLQVCFGYTGQWYRDILMHSSCIWIESIRTFRL